MKRRETFEKEKSTSVKKLAAEVGMKRETVRLILKKDLRMKAYKIQILQHITDDDNVRRLQFCSKIRKMSLQRRLDLNTMNFSDDSHIYLNGVMNKQNFRIWSTQKPIEVFVKQLHAPTVTVWCGLNSHRVHGPFFFEDAETRNACSMKTEAYIEMLNTVMTDDIHPDFWFQQDEATAHTSLAARDWLKNRFGNKIISPLDLFLWGCLKEKVFKSNLNAIDELKQVTRDVISSTD